MSVTCRHGDRGSVYVRSSSSYGGAPTSMDGWRCYLWCGLWPGRAPSAIHPHHACTVLYCTGGTYRLQCSTTTPEDYCRRRMMDLTVTRRPDEDEQSNPIQSAWPPMQCKQIPMTYGSMRAGAREGTSDLILHVRTYVRTRPRLVSKTEKFSEL